MIIKEVVEDFPQPDNDGGRFSTVIHGICFKSKINFDTPYGVSPTSAFTNLNQKHRGNGISLHDRALGHVGEKSTPQKNNER